MANSREICISPQCPIILGYDVIFVECNIAKMIQFISLLTPMRAFYIAHQIHVAIHQGQQIVSTIALPHQIGEEEQEEDGEEDQVASAYIFGVTVFFVML